MRISVVGLGYVGSVAAAALASTDHKVTGIDIDRTRIDGFNGGKVPIFEPGLSDMVRKGIEQRNLRFSHADDTDGPLGDIIVIATGTPACANGSADLSQVKSALEWVKLKQPEGGIVLMKSTVPPGSGKRLCRQLLADTKFEYISSPEFLREGRALRDWFEPDRIVIGTSNKLILNEVKELYRGIDAPYVVTDITSAEMIKYAANAFLAAKISFINEIATLSDRVGAVIDDVCDGIALDPRIGSSFLKAGVGYGGSCFPKDVRALDFLALSNDHNFELLRSVITVNNRQRLLPLHALRSRFGSLRGVKVAVLGIAFKPETDDVREAPSLDLINLLVEEGAVVSAFDPKANGNAVRHIPGAVRLTSDPVSCALQAEAVVVMTEWDEIVNADWNLIAQAAMPPMYLFDGRNALNPEHMWEYGFEYAGVGRATLSANIPALV